MIGKENNKYGFVIIILLSVLVSFLLLVSGYLIGSANKPVNNFEIEDINSVYFDTFIVASACQNYVYCLEFDCTDFSDAIYNQEQRKAICFSADLLNLQNKFYKTLRTD